MVLTLIVGSNFYCILPSQSASLTALPKGEPSERAQKSEKTQIQKGVIALTTAKHTANRFCLLILLQNLLYGIGDPLSKSAYEAMSVYSLLSVRYLIALLAFLLLGRGRIFRELRTCDPRIWLLPSLCIAGCYILNNVALALTDATSVAFLRSLTTVLTPLLAFVVLRTRFRLIHIPIQAFIVLGLYLLCGGAAAAVAIAKRQQEAGDTALLHAVTPALHHGGGIGAGGVVHVQEGGDGRAVHAFPSKIMIRELLTVIIRPEDFLCYQIFHTTSI